MSPSRADTLELLGRSGFRIGPGWVVIFVGVSLFLSGPWLEELFFPVLDTPIIPHDSITRTEERLCWTRQGAKFRVAKFNNYDVFLDRADPLSGQFDDHHRSFPEAFNEATGAPVNTDSTLPAGPIPPRRICVLLPPDLTIYQPIQVTLTTHYRGFLGLWDLPEPFPPIRSLGATNRAAPL